MVNKTKAKILIVEDDKFIIRAYKDGLSRAGFEIILAFDGEEGIKKIKSEKPNLVLLDLVMPIKNGFEVLKELKEELKINNGLKDMSVIILSNLGQDSDVQKGRALGAVDYLIKSDFSMKEVIEKIKRYLKK